jgi:putative DNA primase/helicase
MNYINIPQELKQLPQWVLLKIEKDDKGKPTKIPYQTNGNKAKVNDPTTWQTYESITDFYYDNNEEYAGIQFAFTKNDPYCFIDLDDCIDENGVIEPKSKAIIDKGNTYTEGSYGGKGIHIIAKATHPEGRGNRKGNFEIYTHGHFCVMTGNVLEGFTTIEERQTEINEICAEIFKKPKPTEPTYITKYNLTTDQVIEKARNAKNSAKFLALLNGDISGYKSASEADLAFASLLSFWTQDKKQILNIISETPLWDKKWERPDYQNRTIDKALEGKTEVYSATIPKNRIVQPNGATEKDTEKQVFFNCTDYGNAERLVHSHFENIRYGGTANKWLVWNGQRWETDDRLEIEKLGKDTVRKIYIEAGNCGDDEIRKNIAKWAKGSESNQRIQAMITLARSEPGVYVKAEANPNLFNMQNGTMNLLTGKLQPHNRTDYLTNISPIAYDKTAECPRWMQFLDEIFIGNEKLIQFVKYALGYSLTTSVKEECFFLCYGEGRNGKSKMLDTVEYIMGDYGSHVEPSTFEENLFESGSGAREDIARLKGTRFISTIETADGHKLAEDLIKKMTGDRLITARELYQSSVTFQQTYKIWFGTNHTPKIKGTDNAIWSRVRLIPFERVFTPEEQDRNLLDKLFAEAPGIFNWMLEGCLLWQGCGLLPVTPDKVVEATTDYRLDMNTLQAFISDCCVLGVEKSISVKELYDLYKNWCSDSGEKAESKNLFGKRLGASKNNLKNVCVGRQNVRKWIGIGITDLLS